MWKEVHMKQEQTEVTEALEKPKQAPKATEKRIAIVLVRGFVRAHRDVKHTCTLLHLHRKMNCVIVEDNPVYRGMLQRIKDFVAFGPVSADTEKKLANRKNRDHFTLHPPRGGFERGGIKKAWKRGGALGQRDEMDSLLAKMI